MLTTEQSEQPRLQHLKNIEKKMQERFKQEDLYTTDAPADYS
jgi:hypothetical protein